MAIYLGGETAAAAKPKLDDLTPRQIVEELDKYVVGQMDAKRAVAVALRVDPAVVRPGAYDVVFHIEAVDDPGVSTNEKSRFFVR